MRRLLALLAVAIPSSSFSADRFVCYYGAGRIDELAQYDVVVLQPGRYAADDIARLKAAGHATVLGYVSLGEDDQLRRGSGKGPGGQASWYLDQFTGAGFSKIGSDGVPDSNGDWNSYYVNPADKAWGARIRDEVRAIRALGMDGVFADTVLLPTDKFTADVEKRLRRGMIRLVRSLKGWADGGLVFVNNGYDDLSFLKDRVDGVVVESAVEPERWFWDDIHRIAAGMEPHRRERALRVVSLFYVNSKAEIPAACAALTKAGLTGSFYLRDADGLALNALPTATCP